MEAEEMIPARCDREEAVFEAVRLGAWEDDLRRHATICETCRSVALAARFMKMEAGAHADSHPLPEPGQIWWRAQLRAKREAAARAAQPIAFVEKGAWIGGLAALASALTWGWPAIKGWIATLGSGLLESSTPQAAQIGPSFGTLLGFWSLPVLVTLAVLHAMRAEDFGRRRI